MTRRQRLARTVRSPIRAPRRRRNRASRQVRRALYLYYTASQGGRP